MNRVAADLLMVAVYEHEKMEALKAEMKAKQERGDPNEPQLKLGGKPKRTVRPMRGMR